MKGQDSVPLSPSALCCSGKASQRPRTSSWPRAREASQDPWGCTGWGGRSGVLGGKGGGEWNAGARATGCVGGWNRCEWRWPGAGVVVGKVTLAKAWRPGTCEVRPPGKGERGRGMARLVLWGCSFTQTHNKRRQEPEEGAELRAVG